ncbi:MAG: minor capsid protein [Pseudomonadota bacterium]
MTYSHFVTSGAEYKTIVIPPDEQSKLIEEAMKNAQRTTELAIDEHWKEFLSQMRDKVGVENITLDEPYLKFEIVKNTLEFLKKLEKLESRFTTLPQVDKGEFVMNLNATENRHVMSVKQNMDEQRQQEFGIKKYVWRTAMDDRVRPEHAANEGKVFEWKDGDGPGTEENCRCSAEPFPDENGEPVDHSLRDKILDITLLLASLIPQGRVAKIGIAIVGKLGKIGERIINKVGGNKPPLPKPSEKPAEKPKPDITKRPKGIPKNWETKPTKNGDGVVYTDPKNHGTYIKVQKGNPQSSNPGQRYDNVRVQKDGQSYDVNGNKVPQKSQESHIPIEDFKINEGFF